MHNDTPASRCSKAQPALFNLPSAAHVDEIRRRMVVDARVAENAAGFGDDKLRELASRNAFRRSRELRAIEAGA